MDSPKFSSPTQWLRHLGFYTANITVTILGTIIIPIMYFGPIRWGWVISRWWCRAIFKNAQWFLNISWKSNNILSVPQTVIIACAHQSAWETLALNLIFPRPAFILKQSLMHIPVIGWYLKHFGMIPIRRGKFISKTFLTNAQHAQFQGRPIIIFPEGKRVPFGSVVRCHRGIFFLYQKLNIPVLALSTNSGFFWPPRCFFKRSGCISIQGHPLIEPGLDESTFLLRLQNTLQEGNVQLSKQCYPS